MDATTPPAEDANVFISPANAITDITAMAVNGVFAPVEKSRLVADIDRLDTELQATKAAAQQFIGLNMAQLYAKKAEWIQTVLPEWDKKVKH